MDNLEETDTILRKAQSPKIEPGKNKKYKQTNHKHWNWDYD